MCPETNSLQEIVKPRPDSDASDDRRNAPRQFARVPRHEKSDGCNQHAQGFDGGSIVQDLREGDVVVEAADIAELH